ncbi:MAG: DUF4058 family protein [Fimbriiglobus sp.]|nr:DUF4058 family protein [Fimbriiglobus sp.]
MPIHDWTRVDAGVFHHFHGFYIAAMCRALNHGGLPPDHYAMAEQVAGPGTPDVLALRVPTEGPGNEGGVALAVAPPKVWLEEEVYSRRTKQVTVRRTSGDEVVAVIEIVSPGNKSSRHGLRSFVAKAVEYLNSGVHLLIADLLPPSPRDPEGIHPVIWGEYTDTSFALPADRRLSLVSYLSAERKRAFVEPVAVGGTLPDMPLFLTPTPERYVNVPLERTYTEAWNEVPRRWQQVLAPE